MFDGLKKSLSYYFNDAPGKLTEAAAQNNRAEADRLLDKYSSVDRGMINTPSIAGHTALMTASMNGHDDMAKHLVSRGAYIDFTNHAGQTALMLAALHSPDKAYPALVEMGAKTTAKDERGRTAEDYKKIGEDARAAGKRPKVDVRPSPAYLAASGIGMGRFGV